MTRRRKLALLAASLAAVLVGLAYFTEPFTRYSTYGTLHLQPNYAGEVYSEFNQELPIIVVKSLKWPWQEKYLKYYYLNPQDIRNGYYYWPCGEIMLDGTIVVVAP